MWLSAVDCNSQKLGCGVTKDLKGYHAYCQFCDCEFLCDNSGKGQILQHAREAKHVQGPVAPGMISA